MSITHLLILLVVVVLIFGTKKLRNIGSDLGGAVRDFKKGLDGEEGAAKPNNSSDPNERLRADPPPAGTTQNQNQHDTTEQK
ncbi:Sec-independent protein translocase subunit TatA [Dyella jiangningensis]|uniref:Sec-independent protein translocase protein TatA n=1 Tax=Dyella jiangningensis TaxID=1379159 RepID=A0A328P4U8_9GAMM|nr:Sec-independent protein translocase subunit TatA [Dyella jiangningensis]RAO76650.1 twin-arginine translocase subunit TatA [Dyella jiangningensis]